jgi:ribosome-binding factor A
MKMSRRIERVNELVRREISEIIRRDFGVGEFGVVTVTGVEISSDLKNGKIYVSVVGSPEQQSHALESLGHRHGMIQSEMSRHVILKYTPRLDFVLDQSGERADRINRLLDELGVEKQDAKPVAKNEGGRG